jgi:hypothetical protein
MLGSKDRSDSRKSFSTTISIRGRVPTAESGPLWSTICTSRRFAFTEYNERGASTSRAVRHLWFSKTRSGVAPAREGRARQRIAQE